MNETPPDDPRTHLRAGCVLPVRTGGDGPTRGQVRARGWRRTSHGFYVPPTVDADDVEQRIVEASVVAPRTGAVTGWAALRWLGGRWFSGLDAVGERLPVTIVVSTNDIRPQAGIEVSGEGLNPALVAWVDGVPVTDSRYAVSFCMRYARSPLGALVELEKALFHDLVSIEEMDAFLTPCQNGWTGVPQARAAIVHADENSWSPQETVMREVWQRDAGLPRPLCNVPVFDLAGRHVATPDLIDPAAGVYAEYDGAVHLDRTQRDHDLRREGRLRAHELEGVTMTAPDVARPGPFVDRVRDAYRRASRRPASRRTWTVTPPSWWVPIDTVARRRALSADQRRRLLARRSA